jgi:hypothetical protein
LLIPLRLGVNNINSEYWSELCVYFQDSCCVGLLGGRPNQAVYLLGYNERERALLGHDPHVTLSSQCEVNETLLSEWHQQSLTTLPFSSLDPSLTLGFYFRDKIQFYAFCDRWRERARIKDLTMSKQNRDAFVSPSLFHIEQSPPQIFDFAEDIDLERAFDFSTPAKTHSNQKYADDDEKDEDYVFL